MINTLSLLTGFHLVRIIPEMKFRTGKIKKKNHIQACVFKYRLNKIEK